MEQVRKEAQQISKTMNLSVVRLCFQAFLMDEHGRFTIPVDPVFSHKVYDSSEFKLLVIYMLYMSGIYITFLYILILISLISLILAHRAKQYYFLH